MPFLTQKEDVSQPEHTSYPYSDPYQAGQANAEPATQVVENQAQSVPIGSFMPMDEFARPIATLPANVGVDNRHREFDAQSIYPGDACLFVAK
jgi:hypothetical protein